MDSIELFEKRKEQKRLKKIEAKQIKDGEKRKVQYRTKQSKPIQRHSWWVNIGKRKPTGEKILFETIRSQRKHNCDFCNVGIVHPEPYCFAHILNKWVYPEYRLVENNIALVCSIYCHTHLDLRLRWNKTELKERIDRWEYLRDYFNELPKKYEITKN